MGSIFAGQSGFQTAMGQQVQQPQAQQSGMGFSTNPFTQQSQSPQYDTGFNYGGGSYNFAAPQTPNFSANSANSGQQAVSAQQSGIQQQPQYQNSNFMQQLMSFLGGQSQFQNNPTQNAAQLPAQAPPGNPAQPAITAPTATPGHITAPAPHVDQASHLGGQGWSQGSGLNASLQNQAFNTVNAPGNHNGNYQEMYNAKTGQYGFSNPYLGQFGGMAGSAAAAEAQYNSKYKNDAITGAYANDNTGYNK